MTQHDIERGLRQLGLRRGAVVEVHSSLRSFGRVVGGAPAVVDALTQVVGPGGTIVMSAYPVSHAVPLAPAERARGITWKVRILPEDSDEPTGMGIVADTFRRTAGVLCGTGLHRVCAAGQHANRLSREGYSYLLELDGSTLLLGVGIDRCSSMHVAEVRVPLPDAIQALFSVPEDICRDIGPGWNIGYGTTPDDAWMKVYREADRRGMIRHYQIGDAACMLFRARAVVGIYEDWLRADPFGLFGIPNT